MVWCDPLEQFAHLVGLGVDGLTRECDAMIEHASLGWNETCHDRFVAGDGLIRVA